MRLRLLVEDVPHIRSPRQRGVGDQGSMATPRYRLGAHYRGGLEISGAKQIVECFVELPRFHVVGVAAEPRVSPERVVGIASHLPAASQRGEMRVPDKVLRQRPLEMHLVEVRVARRCGEGAHIDQMRHAFPSQETNELFESPGRMSDCKELTGGHAPRSFRLPPGASPKAA